MPPVAAHPRVMVRDGRKPVYSRDHKVGADETFDRNEVEKPPDAVGGGQGAGSDASDGEGSGNVKAKKKPKSLLERDDDLEAELSKQFGDDGGFTRKQREELEKQAQQRAEEKAMKNGETDEAKADLERLAEIRRKREEDKVKREKQQQDAEVKAAAKVETESKQRVVAEEVARLARVAKDGKCTLNFLNQDNACKKVLKPLCKREGVKAINKAWLSQFPDLLEIKEEGKDLTIYPK